MEARNEKPGRLEQRDRRIADEREIKVARPRSLRVERRLVFPSPARHRTSPQYDSGPFRNLLPDDATELVEPIAIAAEHKAQHIRALRVVRQAALEDVMRLAGHQFGVLPIFCVSSGAMAFIITDPCITTKDSACVDVCPVDCIHPRKDEPEFEQSPLLFIHPDACIACGAVVPACPVSAIYDSPDATPASQKDLIEANAVYRAGDESAVAAATNTVNAHMSAHPELINIPAAERAAAHQS